MRYTLLPIAIFTANLFAVGSSMAQSTHPTYVRVGLGRTEAAPMYGCARFFVEYQPMLSQHWGLAGRLVGVAGKPTQGLDLQAPNQNYKAGYTEIEALWYPLGNAHRVTFAVGAGGFAGYYRHNSYDFLKGNSGQLVDYKLLSYQGFLVGGLGSLNLEVGLGQEQRWRLGLKSVIQSGYGGITSFTSHSLTLARRL